MKTTKNNKRFVNNIWVNGFVDNSEIYGRTVLVNETECVSYIGENGLPAIIKFSEVQDISKVSIMENQTTKVKQTQKISAQKFLTNNFLQNNFLN